MKKTAISLLLFLVALTAFSQSSAQFNEYSIGLTVAKTVTTIRIKLPNGRLHCETLYTTPQQGTIRLLVEFLAREAH